MILVDPTHMLLNTSPVPDPLSDSVLSLDDEIKRILESSSITDHDKASAYERVLQKYLHKVGQVNARETYRQPPGTIDKPTPLNEDKNIPMEKRLINMLPKTMQQKGRALLDHLKEATDLKWNERGELVHQGEIIRDSNISDLMNETVRARKDSIKPKGWDLFAQVLKESNVPLELIGNKNKWNPIEFTPPPLFSRNSMSESNIQTPNTRSTSRGRGGRGRLRKWIPYPRF